MSIPGPTTVREAVNKLDEKLTQTRQEYKTRDEEGNFLSLTGMALKERLESRIETLEEVHRWIKI